MPDRADEPAPPIEELEVFKFVLSAVAIEGATVFEAVDFVPLYEEFIAREVTDAEVQEILNRITKLYRDHGYFLSSAVAPAQPLAAGVLQVQAIEGYVDKVTFEGPSPEGENLDRYAENITGERPLTLATLQRNVLLVDDLPGIAVNASMRKLGDQYGRYELIAEVSHDLVSGSTFINNWGSAGSGPLQSWLSAGLNSALGERERLQMGLLTVPNQPSELLYGELLYNQPIGFNGTYVSLFGYVSEVDRGHEPRARDDESSAFQFSIRGWHPVIRSQDMNLWIRGNFDFTNVEKQDMGDTYARDRLRVLRASTNFNASDSLNGTTFLSGQLSQGLDILDASDGDSEKLTTYKGNSVFTKGVVGVSRLQGLTETIGLQVSARGQKSAQRLLSSEEFCYGGSQFGRAYNFGQICGDDAVVGSVELRYGRNLAFRWLRGYQVFASYDLGVVWNDVPDWTTVRDSRASAGGGIRLTFPYGVRGTVGAAKALRAFDGTKTPDDNRVSFTLSTNF